MYDNILLNLMRKSMLDDDVVAIQLHKAVLVPNKP